MEITETLSTVRVSNIPNAHTEFPVSFRESTSAVKTEHPNKGDPKRPIILNLKSKGPDVPGALGTPSLNSPSTPGPVPFLGGRFLGYSTYICSFCEPSSPLRPLASFWRLLPSMKK